MSALRTGAISSVRHPLLQEIRRALQRGELTSGGLCVAEGRHLLEEARRSRAEVELVIGPKAEDGLPHLAVPDSVLASVASTETSPGVVSLVRLPDWKMSDLLRAPALIVILDGVQDPGNAGTILRSAEAFGASGVVFGAGSVSPYNSKVLRSSAGSIFRMPFVRGEVPGDLPIYAANPRQGPPPTEIDWNGPCAIAIGSEAHGVSSKTALRAKPVRIPTKGVESLNAAISASILLYEASRQRLRA